VATVQGLRGSAAGRVAWLEIAEAAATPDWPLSQLRFIEFFDALLLLHRGLPEQAMQHMDTPPEQLRGWFNGIWRPWYAAAWAEAAAVAGHQDAADRIRRAGLLTLGNPVTAAIVRRVPLPVGQDARSHRRDGTGAGRIRAGRDGGDGYGLASRMRSNGVSVAR
jgi:hypothetical protein